MDTVGIYEAKTHLAQLIERVSRGERIVITRHGVAVAALEPIGASPARPAGEVIEELKLFRLGHRLRRGELKAMIEQGRR